MRWVSEKLHIHISTPSTSTFVCVPCASLGKSFTSVAWNVRYQILNILFFFCVYSCFFIHIPNRLLFSTLTGSAKYGITEFADLTSTEYKQRTGLWQRSEDKPSKNAAAVIPNIELPKEFDWRE